MKQHTIRPSRGAHRARKRVGRGDSSGYGTTAGKGTKGQKARTGGGVPPRFEGGQLPLVKRLPFKRGFVNAFRTEYAEVNVGRLAAFEAGIEVTPELLVQKGVIKNSRRPIKILGNGDLTVALTVRANKFTAGAKAKIEAAGGRAEELSS